MPHRRGKRLFRVIATSTGSDDGLMAVKMNLCLELVPQFVVRWPLHVSAQQLDLLHPERQTKGRCYFKMQAMLLG